MLQLPRFLSWRLAKGSLPAQCGFVLALAATHACDDGEEACRRSRTCAPTSGAKGVEGSLSGRTEDEDGAAAAGAGGEGGVAGITGHGGLGGLGGAEPTPDNVPQKEGDACSPNGIYACTGHAKRSQLVCKGGAFTTYGACRTTERCDTRPETEGLCQPMVPECFGHDGGDVVCRGAERLVCGIDLITADSLDTCPAGCVDGVCTECSPDVDPTCEFNARRSCTAEGTWELEGCAAETPHCSGGECGPPPSCLYLDENCGLEEDEPCCASPLVTGGEFDRNNDPAMKATISDFRLDRFEVTVGRFRKFKAAWDAGWRPDGGSGKHVHVRGGLGLIDVNSSDTFEPGWKETYLAKAEPSDSNLLGTNDDYATWTPATWNHEQHPINRVTRFEAYAFCIWDGGFLPSDAEWSYAASGGDEQRPYPWGDTLPGADTELAVYGCYFQASGTCTNYENIAPVGTSQGEGRFGQLDLVGNLNEWALGMTGPTACVDCARPLTMASNGIDPFARGRAYHDSATAIATAAIASEPLGDDRSHSAGFRCARSP